MTYPITSPINDNFEQLLSQLAHDQVTSWDLKDTINYCISKLEEDKKSRYSLTDLVEDYEEFYNLPIVEAIANWNINPIQWGDFFQAECYAMVKMHSGSPEALGIQSINKQQDDILCWAIYLRNTGGQVLCILNVEDEEEAVLITESINVHYFSNLEDRRSICSQLGISLN